MISMLSVQDEGLHFGPVAGNCIPLLPASVQARILGVAMGFSRAVSTVLCCGGPPISSWALGSERPDPQERKPITPFLSWKLRKEPAFSHRKKKRRRNLKKRSLLTSPPLPFAFQNPRETLKDLKAQKLLIVPVQKWIQGDSCRLAAKLWVPFRHPTAPCVGAECGGFGEALPIPEQRCTSVRKLFRKSCLPGCVGRIRAKRGKRQRDWFCGCVATAVI